jgi:hypothetical protein
MIDLRDKRDGLPTSEVAVAPVTTADLAEQRANLLTNEDVAPSATIPIHDNRTDIRNNDAPNGDRANAVQNNTPPDVTIEASATRDQGEWGTASSNTDQREETVDDTIPLFSEFEINDLRARWSDVQAGFVDAPRRSVEQADELVAAVMQRLASGFAQERSTLERQWDRGDSISTEDLRVALQRYRAFFGRLLNAA